MLTNAWHEMCTFSRVLFFTRNSPAQGHERMERSPPSYRHTKIITTLGPATESSDQLTRLIRSGVDIFRLNMAHADPAWVREIVARVRELSSSIGRDVAIMMDVKGPEIRTGDLEQRIELIRGQRIQFHTRDYEDDAGDLPSVSVNYADLPHDVSVGDTVLVDSGLIRLGVIAKSSHTIECEVVTPGTLGSRRHINLPGVAVNLPALTEKDHVDLAAGVEAGIDFVALSFVRQADDVGELRQRLDNLGSKARIIAKIEDQAGVRHMESIVRAADGIMVARGDLGIEIDYPSLPLVQTELVRVCQAEGKPAIIATHLLESMIQSPMPTRAEISDVCNAVREQADAVMLSGETTTGAYPLESVDVLKNILHSIEPTIDASLNCQIKLREPKAKMLRSSAILAQELGDSGIVVFTRSGFLAYVLAALRPRGIPIFAFTDHEPVFRQLLLPWGVEPFLMDFSGDPEQTVQNSLDCLKQKGWCQPGMWLVFITNVLAGDQVIDSLQLRQVS